uniref:Uncharacterized protein n=1 Tax=Pseudomonas fluorescens (strain SBW25) TaxID=216595 RepID=A0A0G4E5D2_PSEFS|nr:hypothetical protein PQBR57_0275 [Pseudomonas fluorescens SBW25]
MSLTQQLQLKTSNRCVPQAQGADLTVLDVDHTRFQGLDLATCSAVSIVPMTRLDAGDT